VKLTTVLIPGAALSMTDALKRSGVLHRDYFRVYRRTDARLASIFAGGAAYLLLRDRLLLAWICPGAPALAVVVANLSVAERLIFEEDHPVVRDLIVRSIRDLATACGAERSSSAPTASGLAVPGGLPWEPPRVLSLS
jgi:hypothetical protein